MLDNRRDALPEAVGFKLDYVRNRMQAFIDQMLYYARLRGARRDYRFERLALLEESKSLPWNAVWDMFCLKNDVPVGEEFIADVQRYEAEVTSKR